MTTLIVTFDVEEFCETAKLSRETLVEIVELGILEPSEAQPEHWSFGVDALTVARRALSLKRDFELDWPGTALALRLFDQVEQLKRENRLLRQQLQRFVDG